LEIHAGLDAARAIEDGMAVAPSRGMSSNTPANLDLPAEEFSGENLRKGSVYFVGTATVIIQCGGFTVLTDPNFLHSGEKIHMGYGLLSSTRRTDPAMEIEQLPRLDLVVLSHMHEDHFDRVAAERLNKNVPILTTPDAARDLRRKDFHFAYGLETWQEINVRKGISSVRITSMPAQHGPLMVAAMLPSCMGSVLDFKIPGARADLRLYVSGDTIVHSDLQRIPALFPGIDIALIHLGGARIMGIRVTMDGKQGVEALQIIAPRIAIPIHFDDYDVFKSPLDEFRAEVEKAGLANKVRYLDRGEAYQFELAGQEFRTA
jgi:L-ascorbate metabolism protein UlaG (beta-lactamase superfamily)